MKKKSFRAQVASSSALTTVKHPPSIPLRPWTSTISEVSIKGLSFSKIQGLHDVCMLARLMQGFEVRIDIQSVEMSKVANDRAGNGQVSLAPT